MAIAFRAESATTITSVSTITGTEPTGAAQDDMIVAHFSFVGDPGAFNAPTGWTAGPADSISGALFRNSFYIQRGSSAPTYAFTWTNSVSGEMSVQAFSG